MYVVKQSTALTVPFFAHDVNGDGVTGLVDGGFTKRISKGSGAWAAMTVTITEMENGWYSFPLSGTHSDTLGLLSISFSHGSTKRVNLQWRVEANLLDNLATPTNITAATGVVLSGVTHTGAVIPTVTTVGTLTTYTGNTVQTGDSFARLGAPAGASVSADLAAMKVDTAAILVDTGTTLDGRIPAALTGAGNIKADVLAINGNTTSAAVLAILNGATVVYQGTVTGAATTTSLVDTGLTQADADWWKGRIIIFTSVITMQATDILTFTPGTDTLTFTAVTTAPTGATYVII